MIRLPDLLAGSLIAAGPGYMPERASSVAEGVDQVFALLFWMSAFFLVVIIGLTVLFVIRYRARASRPGPEASPDHSTKLEIFWTAIPLLLVFVIFAASTKVYLAMTELEPGANPQRVQVTARKWSWWFDHAGGKGSKELHVLVGRPVELVLASTDVVHSLYVPQFRLKQDAVPGRFTRMVFTPTVPGTYPILCTEYCGTNHSTMSAVAVVHPDQASFDAWAAEGKGGEESLLQVGVRVFEEKGCSACHSVDGSPGVGPSIKGIWGKDEKLTDGKIAKVDENYIRESIVTPGAKIVAGFDDMMPPVPLDDREIQGIVAYIQSLKEGP
ncbi:MAG: cytochrome c oxidase subunit II [Deltaproteobacteria bacterium]